MYRKSPSEETESSKYSDFSLAELWLSPTSYAGTGQGGIFSSSSRGSKAVSFPVGDARCVSSCPGQECVLSDVERYKLESSLL